jgi:hypothetical protein
MLKIYFWFDKLELINYYFNRITDKSWFLGSIQCLFCVLKYSHQPKIKAFLPQPALAEQIGL